MQARTPHASLETCGKDGKDSRTDGKNSRGTRAVPAASRESQQQNARKETGREIMPFCNDAKSPAAAGNLAVAWQPSFDPYWVAQRTNRRPEVMSTSRPHHHPPHTASPPQHRAVEARQELRSRLQPSKPQQGRGLRWTCLPRQATAARRELHSSLQPFAH